MAVPQRIKLRIDSYENWERSLAPMYEGEVGIGYEVHHDSIYNVDEKSNFKIKIGRSMNGHNYCTWKQAADLSIAKLDPEEVQNIIDQVLAQIDTSTFVTKIEYNEFKDTINQTLNSIKTRLSTRVKACVSDAVLMLSTDD